MLSILYILQFVITILVILLVMFQKGKGSAGLISSNPYNTFFANKALVSNPLTKITIVFGFALFINSITIGALEINHNKPQDSIINKIESIQKDKADSEAKSNSKTTNTTPIKTK